MDEWKQVAKFVGHEPQHQPCLSRDYGGACELRGNGNWTCCDCGAAYHPPQQQQQPKPPEYDGEDDADDDRNLYGGFH